jgi:hypothetical protein
MLDNWSRGPERRWKCCGLRDKCNPLHWCSEHVLVSLCSDNLSKELGQKLQRDETDPVLEVEDL